MKLFSQITFRGKTAEFAIIAILCLCVSSFGYSQVSFELDPDLLGYESCGSMENPIKCNHEATQSM